VAGLILAQAELRSLYMNLDSNLRGSELKSKCDQPVEVVLQVVADTRPFDSLAITGLWKEKFPPKLQ
jgi:hypothetical protein